MNDDMARRAVNMLRPEAQYARGLFQKLPATRGKRRTRKPTLREKMLAAYAQQDQETTT